MYFSARANEKHVAVYMLTKAFGFFLSKKIWSFENVMSAFFSAPPPFTAPWGFWLGKILPKRYTPERRGEDRGME